MAKRMFVALEPSVELAEALAALDPGVAGLRWLAGSQLHLTLGFFGTVPGECEQPLIAALAGIGEPRFSLELRGLGCFARHGQPAVVWVGVADAPQGLFRLRERVLGAGLEAGLTPDGKPFHPHFTVARGKGIGAAELRHLLERHGQSGFGIFEVTGFTLYSSVLRPQGAEHRPVFRQDLP